MNNNMSFCICRNITNNNNRNNNKNLPWQQQPIDSHNNSSNNYNDNCRKVNIKTTTETTAVKTTKAYLDCSHLLRIRSGIDSVRGHILHVRYIRSDILPSSRRTATPRTRPSARPRSRCTWRWTSDPRSCTVITSSQRNAKIWKNAGCAIII